MADSTNTLPPIESLQALAVENNKVRAEQSSDYKKAIIGLAAFLFISFVANIVLGAIIYKQKPTAIGITNDGRVIPITPIDTPVGSNAQVLKYAAEAYTELYHIDFVNLEAQLEAKRNWFFQPAFPEWRKSLQMSGAIERILKETSVMQSVPTSAPVIAYQGKHPLNGNVWIWKVQFPVILTFYGKKGPSSQSLRAEMIIRRVPQNEDIRGIAVESVNLS